MLAVRHDDDDDFYVKQTIRLNSHLFTLLNVKTVLFQTTPISISTQFSFI